MVNLNDRYRHIVILYLVLSTSIVLRLDLKIKVRDLLQIRRNKASVKNFSKNFSAEISGRTPLRNGHYWA